MPTLAQFWFHDRFFGGNFDVFNEPYPDGGWAWISGGGAQSTLAWNRPDDETVIDFAQVLASPVIARAIDGMLTGDVSRTSGVLAQGVFWRDVPYHGSDPGRHSDWDMLVRVYFDMHIHTPWYCTDADGSISYYLMFYLDSAGRLHGSVDGWSFSYGGGGPFCTGGIDDALNAAVPAGIPIVANLVNEALALLGSGTCSSLHYLPGSGRRDQGDFNENADTDVALVLIPGGGN